MTSKPHQPLVSVIMAVHNETDLLRMALHDILNQTYSHFEVIVVDDASVIETENIVKSFTDPRIHYLRLDEQSGQSAARNKGLLAARGEFIAISDADDRWLPGKLEAQVNYFNAHPDMDVVGTWAKTLPHNKEWRTPVTCEDIRAYMLINNPFVHSSVMLKAALLHDKLVYNSKYDTAEDYELFAGNIFQWKFANIPEFLTLYLTSDKSNAKQLQLARDIRGKLLKETVNAEEDEIALHNLFCENAAGLEMDKLKKWVEKLKESNQKISSNSLSNVLQQQVWQYFIKNKYHASGLMEKASALLQSRMPATYIAKTLLKILLNKPL